MTKLRADEYAVLISAKLHALASSVSCGSSNKASFSAAMIRIAHLADALDTVRVEETEKKRLKIRPVL